MSRIFVQIAAYRDPELVPTVEDLFTKAKNPSDITVCIAWQHGDEEDITSIKRLPQVKIIDIPWQESKGACWARNITQQHYSNEQFTLQLDSHHRFVKNWDEKVLDSWVSLNDSKAIITGYPPMYTPGLEEDKWYSVPQICNVYRFDHIFPLSRPANLLDWETKTKPVKGIYISAGFIFGPGQICKEVPYDPEFYFAGEECAMAVRYFTHGYNLYNSHQVIVHHYYQRLECKKHWSDHSNWGIYNEKAHDRLNCLLKRNNKYDLGKYGLGTSRSLSDYKTYAGIDFENCIVHKDTELGIEPPCSNSVEGWDNKIARFCRNISWDFTKIEKCDDPRFWAAIILDQNGVAITREDWVYSNYKDIIEGKVTSKQFSFDHSITRQIPTQLLIWPYSESKTWLTPFYTPI